MFLFHGSPYVANIVESGFDERHSCATGMFGAGGCVGGGGRACVTWSTVPVLRLQESTLPRTRLRATSMCLASAAEAARSTQTGPATPVKGMYVCTAGVGQVGSVSRQTFSFS